MKSASKVRAPLHGMWFATSLVSSFACSTPSSPKADAAPAPKPVDVLTHHNDNARTGANTAETCLVPSVVNTLGLRAKFHLNGQIYAQPLLLTNTNERDLLIVASTANELVAFDVGTLSTTPVWQLGQETFGIPGNIVRGVQGPLGILSTPVIDPGAQRLYVVGRSCATATTLTSCPWTLHAIDTSSGKQLDSTVITTSFKDTQGVSHTFDPDVQWNRPALLLQNGTVFVGWEVGQNAYQHEAVQPFHGMLMAFATANIHKAPVTFVTTPNGFGAGVWQGGGGPAGDGTAVYFNSGNSVMNPSPSAPSGFPATPRDHENSVIRLDLVDGGVRTTSYYDDRPYHADGNVFQYLNYYDVDLSSSGVALIPESNDLVLGSKGGIVYLLDRSTMRQNQTPLSPFTAVPLPAGQTLHIATDSIGPGFFGTPVVWRRAADALVFMWPLADHLTSFRYEPTTRTMSVLARSADISAGGAMLSLTADGTQPGSAVLWANVSSSGPVAGAPAEIRAYDPDTLTVTWRSTLPGYAKWVCPTVSGGRVYVPSWTPSGGSEVMVFATPACGN